MNTIDIQDISDETPMGKHEKRKKYYSTVSKQYMQ